MFKHSKGGKFFSKYMDKRLACFYVYGYSKIIVVLYSNVVWPTHSMYDYFFTHEKLMVAYQKLTPGLHFNYNQLLFATCFFDTLKICWYIKIKFNWKLLCISKHSKDEKKIQNTLTRSYHVSIYDYCKIVIDVSKILRKSSWSPHGAPCSMISPWKSFY